MTETLMKLFLALPAAFLIGVVMFSTGATVRDHIRHRCKERADAVFWTVSSACALIHMLVAVLS